VAVKDAFDRTIDYLRISVTDRCNLRCLYCLPEKGVSHFEPGQLLTAGEIVRVVRLAAGFGVRKVRITGGEPLLRNDIVPLVREIKDAGIADLSLTTNGMLLSGMARALKDAGLDRVNVSLDTMEAGKFSAMTRGGEIRRVWEAIADAERAGLRPVKLNMVPIRGMNDDEIAGFASLTIERDFHVRFIEFMPMGGERLWNRDAWVGKDEVMRKVAGLGELVPVEFRGRGPSRNYRLRGARGVIGFISPISDHFCGFCNRLRLTAVGRIRPCLFSEQEIDLRTPMREGASDEELAGLFLCAVRAKPAGHLMNPDGAAPGCPTPMSRIGG
jgi:cyclic pyranopterin phosphate synthase